MLANINRLIKTEDFSRVKERGKLFQSLSFALSLYDRKDDGPPRFGFVVSNKVSRKAVLRNRVKRALREAVRQHISYVKKGIDVVFLAKHESLSRGTFELSDEVQRILKSTKII